jgi:hypothetical protein
VKVFFLGKPTAIEAWIVGKSFLNPNDITQGFDGPAMDVGVYSSFVYCKQ